MPRAADDHQLRVLIATSTFPLDPHDGSARFILDLAASLSSSTEVMVLAPHAPGAQRRERIGRVHIRRFRYAFPPSFQRLAYGPGMTANIDRSLVARLQVPLLLLSQFWAMMTCCIRWRPDVVNSHWLVPSGFTAALLKKVLGFKHVLHVHAADVYFLARVPAGRWVARFGVRSSDDVFADGSHVRDSLDELIGSSSGAHLRPMGVWTEAVSENHDRGPNDELPDRFVIFVGRLVEKKGVEYLIRALAGVREHESDLELVLIGGGPLEDDLRALASTLGLESVVHFLGPRPHPEVFAALRLAQVACVPSIVDSNGETEGMPTVVIEAMAAGARVVGSRVDGIPDVLTHAENGWLVEPADVDSLTSGLLAAVTDRNGDAISARGVQTAKRHDWAVVAEEYRAVLLRASRG